MRPGVAQAGKDVYVEKPCSHAWWEGHQLVQAARKYDRIAMHGDARPDRPKRIAQGVRKLREGLIGGGLLGARPLL